MKLRTNPSVNLIPPQISKHEVVHQTESTRRDEYVHPWYEYVNRPNPPTKEAVEKSKFIDKTYQWTPKNRTT